MNTDGNIVAIWSGAILWESDGVYTLDHDVDTLTHMGTLSSPTDKDIRAIVSNACAILGRKPDSQKPKAEHTTLNEWRVKTRGIREWSSLRMIADGIDHATINSSLSFEDRVKRCEELMAKFDKLRVYAKTLGL